VIRDSYDFRNNKHDLPVVPIGDFLTHFTEQGVKLHALLGYKANGSMKDYAAKGLLDAALRHGVLKPGKTKLIEATSGRTGLRLTYRAFGEPYKCPGVSLVMRRDVPPQKIWAPQMAGATIIHPPEGVNPIDHARALGGGGWRPDCEGGWHASEDDVLNLDQYANPANGEGYETEVAPMVAEQLPLCNLAFLPLGTGGTVFGLGHGLKKYFHNLKVIASMCRLDEEIPGVRDADGVRKVHKRWEGIADWRMESFAKPAYLSALWFHRVTDALLGPSGGLPYFCYLAFIDEQIKKGTLDQFRSPEDGKVHALIVVHDDSGPYCADRFPTLITGDWWSNLDRKPWDLLGSHPPTIED
jgi:cysteine synthase